MANCLDGLAEGLFERHGVSFFKGSFHGIAKRTNFDVLGGTSYWQDGTPDAPEGANRVDGGRPRRDAGDRAGARPHNRRGVEVACALCQRPLFDFEWKQSPLPPIPPIGNAGIFVRVDAELS
jgi:hypothetical protein